MMLPLPKISLFSELPWLLVQLRKPTWRSVLTKRTPTHVVAAAAALASFWQTKAQADRH
jgi:hypothetical protein